MKKTNKERLQDLMAYVDRLTHIEPGEIPDIQLYMDQVTTFMNERLAGTRHDTDEVVVTKTMINNYAKNRLLPAPVKKKYSRNHILMLILIYYFKNVVSFSEIEALFSPLSQKHFAEGSVPELSELYRAPEEDREFLRLYAFVCELAFDVYIKKEMIELLADELRTEQSIPSRKR